MSDPGLSRRKQQLLDKFLAGEIDKPTYDNLLAQLHELDSAVAESVVHDSNVEVASSASFEVTESRTSAERSALASPVALLEAGMELGSFQLKRRLRRGGMGEVWQAFDPTGERTVVIKVLPPELQRSPDEMARVKQTFNRVHNLQHQHICPVYLLGQDPRFGYFIVMKYLDGDTLSAYRKAFVQAGKQFSLAEVVRVLMPIAKALDYAHSRQIIHRDIKPQNIMLRPDGSDVQLVDFGLAAEVRTSVMRVSQVQMETCGTYPYMAPEQWRGEMQDARTDQYALAVVAFEVLAGHLPFEAADPTVLRMCVLNDSVPQISSVSKTANVVVARGMAKARADRFDSCSAFIKALANAGVDDVVDEDVLVLDESAVTERVERPQTPVTTRRAPSVHDREVKPTDPTPSEVKSGQSKPNARPISSTSSKAGSKPSVSSTKPPTRRTAVDDLDDADHSDDNDDLLEDDDDRDSKRRSRSSVNRRPSREKNLEHVNRRAMVWVSLIGGSVCLLFVGLFSWFIWTKVLGPSKPNTTELDPSQLVANESNGNQANQAVPDKNVVPPIVRPEDKNAPRYRWEQGKQYVYSVKVEMEPDPDVVVTLSGNTTYMLGQPVAKKKAEPDEGKGTGTGFVVHSDGYLITCQHVVGDASEIEVAIGGKKYPASIIIEDVEHDLAIIRIDAKGLATLPLADSDTVQLGEEVRAIGFPLSSILGDNIKATRGTISGVNQEDGRKIFQVDAGINPGNSGGPLVNERGEIVGVNFAKLREEMGTNVGFAVPVNDAIALLRNEGITFTSGNGKTPKLDGPDLVKRVSAATALITVNTNGPVKGMHRFELKCSGSLNSSSHSKSGKAVDPFAGGHLRNFANRGFSQPDIVETDALGRVHDITGERVSLPGFMGPLAIMVLEQLPSIRRQNWSNQFAVTIVISDGDDAPQPGPMRFGPRFRPPGFPGMPGFPRFQENNQKTTRVPGKIRIAYTLQDGAGDLLKIKKDFELEARERAGGEPRVKLTGTGIFTFDQKTGVPRSLDYTANLIENEPNKQTKLPIKLTYQLVEGAQGNIAVAPADPVFPGKPVDNDVALPAGTRLVAEWAGKWLPVEVLSTQADGRVRIHWVGWGDQFDEDVARSRLRFPIGVDPADPGKPNPGPQNVAAAPQEPIRLTAAEVNQYIADLQSKNAGKSNTAATKLAQAVPLDDHRDDVIKVLEAMLKEKDQFRRKQAVEVLGTWAKPETIPLLIRCLDESALLVKLAAIDSLGRLKDERAAEPLAKLMTEPGPRVQAFKALEALGSKAEAPVLKLLTHAEPEVRQEACRLLKGIGTAASLPALQRAAEDTNKTIATLAKDAITAISKRQ